LIFITIRKLEGIRFIGIYSLRIFLKPTKRRILEEKEKKIRKMDLERK